MMKLSIALLYLQVTIILLSTSASKAQTDTWFPVDTTGFGSAQNYAVIEFAVFRDTLYACMSRRQAGAAELWRSGTGNANEWEQVIYDSTTTTVKGIPSINTTTEGGGYMWIATGNPTEGTQVYRTDNGTDWIPISLPGFGDPAKLSPAPNMVVFEGPNDTIPHLYAAAGSHQAGTASAQVYRTPYNNTNPMAWDTIVDFALFDPTCTQITYFYEWNNKLYFGANGTDLLFESTDGVNFSPNAGAGTDFGDPGNLLIAALIEDNGWLYAATNNQAFGGHLYRTSDGTTWDPITTNAFGFNHIGEELHHLDTANNRVWVTAYTDTSGSNGVPIWSSPDGGSTFPQSNLNGFGNPNIDGENAITIGFHGRQYFGGPNYVNGGQVWRTGLLNTVEQYKDQTCKAVLAPNPFHDQATLVIGVECEGISSVEIFDSTGKLVRSIFANNNKITIDRNMLKSGIYFYNMRSKKGAVQSGKFVIL